MTNDESRSPEPSARQEALPEFERLISATDAPLSPDAQARVWERTHAALVTRARGLIEALARLPGPPLA